ncbi:MAG: TonB-dependent siderophore receptor [Leptolyngbya sp. SIO1E4]|nr:TonB-dependent siderophore receptor [Leptolyngbya sp. SIO1E4]
MRLWLGSVSLPLAGVLVLAGLSAQAQDVNQATAPATTVTEWLAQIEASLVQITDVRVEATDAGLQVVLETADGTLVEPTTSVSGDALIVEIPNAVLVGEGFEEFAPAEGIALVQVSPLAGDRVQVVITGADAVPEVAVGSNAAGLTLSVVPGMAQAGEANEAIQIVVTGEVDEGYNPSSATTATRTDTPLRDIPQSIQVVPRQVLEDRNVRTVNEAIETVSGVIDGGDTIFRIFRGFSTNGTSQLRNGNRIGDTFSLIPEEPVVAIERVEVLKGPSSVLYGALEPGGVINTITRQPLSEPYYNLAFEVGNPGLYQPSVDLTGPLTSDESVLYRFIAAYSSEDGYFEGGGRNNTLIAPSITFDIGDRTSLDLYYEYSRYAGDLYGSLHTVARSDGSFLLRDVNVWGNRELTFDERVSHKYGFSLGHEFNENLRLRTAFSANNFSVPRQRFAVPIGIVDDRFVELFYLDRTQSDDTYFGQVDLLGSFNTGSISHQLLVGVDYENAFQRFESFSSQILLPLLDSLNPDYDVTRPTDLNQDFESERLAETYGVYLQDQIEFSDNLKLLIGGRYDWAYYREDDITNDIDEPTINDGAFSPRVGLVYQPSDTVSLYASYSRSFRQTTEFNPDGEVFEPTRGTQYEIGTKLDFLEGRLSTSLVAYHLTRTNITTPDPENPVFSIQTGEARSQGVELDVAGEILPGWNVILSYAYTDAEVTEDNDISVGNQLNNVPFNQASLWTTYEIQAGDLAGLGFGLGLFFVGERQGDLANSFELDSYLRTDAALYYRRDQLNAAINIRNLFDIDYASFADSPTLIGRGEPFTITGSISWEF